jgi:hypothetical protein
MPTRMERLTAKLDRLRAAEAKVKAELQAAEARQRARQNKAKRAADTRRRILLGAWLLERMKKDEALRARLVAELDAWVTRNDDRALFGLEPRSHDAGSTPEAAATAGKGAQHG